MKKAFSVVDALVALVVVTLLVAILYPVFETAHRHARVSRPPAATARP